MYVCIHVHLLQELGKVREGAGEKERHLITLETELNRYAADECLCIYIYIYSHIIMYIHISIFICVHVY